MHISSTDCSAAVEAVAHHIHRQHHRRSRIGGCRHVDCAVVLVVIVTIATLITHTVTARGATWPGGAIALGVCGGGQLYVAGAACEGHAARLERQAPPMSDDAGDADWQLAVTIALGYAPKPIPSRYNTAPGAQGISNTAPAMEHNVASAAAYFA